LRFSRSNAFSRSAKSEGTPACPNWRADAHQALSWALPDIAARVAAASNKRRRLIDS
jgi:hypothetical protein